MTLLTYNIMFTHLGLFHVL